MAQVRMSTINIRVSHAITGKEAAALSVPLHTLGSDLAHLLLAYVSSDEKEVDSLGVKTLRICNGSKCVKWSESLSAQGIMDRSELTYVWIEVAVPQKAICACADHTAALRDDGVVEAWGWNVFGQAPQEKRAAVGRFMIISARDHHSTASHDDCPGGRGGDGQASPGKRQRLS